MALITENGWRQCSRNECVTPVVPGTTNVKPEFRGGDAATILIAWCAWYHRNVETIDRYKPRDYWAWSATNDVWNSNHLSGTAIDLCATQYPWGRRVIFWGADWSRADEMHYQLNYPEGDRRIADFAAKLNSGHLGIYGSTPAAKDSSAVWDDVYAQLTGGVS